MYWVFPALFTSMEQPGITVCRCVVVQLPCVQNRVLWFCRMSMKLCKEALYGLTVGIEQLVLQNSARLVQHTASAGAGSILSTAAATIGQWWEMTPRPLHWFTPWSLHSFRFSRLPPLACPSNLLHSFFHLSTSLYPPPVFTFLHSPPVSTSLYLPPVFTSFYSPPVSTSLYPPPVSTSLYPPLPYYSLHISVPFYPLIVSPL